MADNNGTEQISWWQSFWRFVTFYKARKALGLMRKADEQFTTSASGISDAYEIEKEKLITDFNEMMSALSEAETAMQMKRDQLPIINGKLKREMSALDGALSAIERAQDKKDSAAEVEATRDAAQFQAAVDKLTEQAEALQADITEKESSLKGFEEQLGQLKERIKALPMEKAQAIADFVSADKMEQAFRRLNGLQRSSEKSPLDAVQEAIKRKQAGAKVASRLNDVAGSEESKKNKYIEDGQAQEATSQVQKLLEARKREREAATGTGPATPQQERPQI